MRIHLLFFILVAFGVATAQRNQWNDIMGKLVDIVSNPVNGSTEGRVIKEESEKLKIHPEQLISNCQDTWSIWAMSPEEYALFNEERTIASELGIFYPIEKFLEGIARIESEVYSHETVSDSQPLIDNVLSKLDETAEKFARNLHSKLAELAIKVQHSSDRSGDHLVSSTLTKVANDFGKLSKESKENLERETCWFTLMRLLDTDNELANMILQTIDPSGSQFHNEL